MTIEVVIVDCTSTCVQMYMYILEAIKRTIYTARRPSVREKIYWLSNNKQSKLVPPKVVNNCYVHLQVSSGAGLIA